MGTSLYRNCIYLSSLSLSLSLSTLSILLVKSSYNTGIKGSANLYHELDDYDDEKVRVGDKVVLSVRPGLATAVYDTAEMSEESYSQIVLRSDILGHRTATCESIDDTYNHLAINNITTRGIISEGQYGCVNDA